MSVCAAKPLSWCCQTRVRPLNRADIRDEVVIRDRGTVAEFANRQAQAEFTSAVANGVLGGKA